MKTSRSFIIFFLFSVFQLIFLLKESDGNKGRVYSSQWSWYLISGPFRKIIMLLLYGVICFSIYKYLKYFFLKWYVLSHIVQRRSLRLSGLGQLDLTFCKHSQISMQPNFLYTSQYSIQEWHWFKNTFSCASIKTQGRKFNFFSWL